MKCDFYDGPIIVDFSKESKVNDEFTIKPSKGSVSSIYVFLFGNRSILAIF